MKLSAFSIAFAVVVATTATGSAQSPRGKDLEKPLVIAKQGSFFVGGEKKALPAPPQLDAEARRLVATSPSTRCTCSIRFRPMAIVTCRS